MWLKRKANYQRRLSCNIFICTFTSWSYKEKSLSLLFVERNCHNWAFGRAHVIVGFRALTGWESCAIQRVVNTLQRTGYNRECRHSRPYYFWFLLCFLSWKAGFLEVAVWEYKTLTCWPCMWRDLFISPETFWCLSLLFVWEKCCELELFLKKCHTPPTTTTTTTTIQTSPLLSKAPPPAPSCL